MRLLAALTGLVISFAVPTFAQQKDTGDTKILQQIRALAIEYANAFNRHDAAAVAAFFTEDAVLVTDKGPIYGREAIEKHFADLFQNLHFSNHIDKADQYSPHIIGTAGDEMWSNGEWSLTLQEKTGDPIPLKG